MAGSQSLTIEGTTPVMQEHNRPVAPELLKAEAARKQGAALGGTPPVTESAALGAHAGALRIVPVEPCANARYVNYPMRDMAANRRGSIG